MYSIEHFGLKIKSHKNDFALNEGNYIVVSNKNTLIPFNEFLLKNYSLFPSSFSVCYLKKLIEFYNNIPKAEITKKQTQNLIKSLNLLQKLEAAQNNNIKIEQQSGQKQNILPENINQLKLNNKICNYINSFDFFLDIEGHFRSQEWCKKQASEAKQNFKLNMEYFNSLNKQEFNAALSAGLKKAKEFSEITDLTPYIGKSGYYILVLDNYNQIYIGSTSNITKRVREHWCKIKAFDRLLFPMHAVKTSTLSIDSFRALDTTRIYVYCTSKTFDREDEFIRLFPQKFVLNRVAGGLAPTQTISKNLKNN